VVVKYSVGKQKERLYDISIDAGRAHLRRKCIHMIWSEVFVGRRNFTLGQVRSPSQVLSKHINSYPQWRFICVIKVPIKNKPPARVSCLSLEVDLQVNFPFCTKKSPRPAICI